LKTICFFNNKGGVGKTTLTCNIAAHFASAKKRVLVIDADPQCNATQLIVGDEKVLDFYWPEKVQHTGVQTILDVVTPIQEGDANIEPNIRLLSLKDNRFGVELLPGHPRFSIVDDKLSQAWHEALGGDIGGLRKTNWCHTLCESLSGAYDYAFIDIGPSLGSINRSVLLASDYFVTPLGADVFSIVGVRNISDWLRDWIKLYKIGVSLCDNRSPKSLDKFSVRRELLIERGYIGYTLQQYITKSKGGVRRPTEAFEKILSQVPNQIEASLGTFFAGDMTMEEAKLGDVPNMYSLIPLAQSVNAPILGLSSSDGLVGTQFKQSKDYAEIIHSLAKTLARNLGSPLGGQV
jgi:cellulose biosynthesis protein BcsQ